MNTYYPGQSVRLSANFTDAAGAAANPSTVTVKTYDPLGHVDSHTIASGATTGYYEYIFVPVVEGIWEYRFESTGTITTAEEGKFRVQPSRFS